MDSQDPIQARIKAYTDGYRAGYRTAIANVLEMLNMNNQVTGAMSQDRLLSVLQSICSQVGNSERVGR